MSQGLAIVGYGKMGKLIERLAPEYGFEVRAKFSGGDNPGGQGLSHETLRGIDVAVEFTTPVAAPVNIAGLLPSASTPSVGTTGWLANFCRARSRCASEDGSRLGRKFFRRRKSFSTNRRTGRRSLRETSRIRSLGLGNPSLRKKRCA